jgi:hypothetical protein
MLHQRSARTARRGQVGARILTLDRTPEIDGLDPQGVAAASHGCIAAPLWAAASGTRA